MPITHYKLLSVRGPVGSGALASQYFAVQGVAKCATADYPFIVASEYVCGRLGRMLGLPIPPGFTVDSGGVIYHVSMDFNLTGQALPPADVVALVGAFPDLASGITIFDAWLLNQDRHDQNVSFDRTSQQVSLFDHSHAFLAGKEGTQYLEKQKDTLFGPGSHCLAPLLPNLDGVNRWLELLRQVPRFFLEDTISRAVDLGLPQDKVDFCRDFLVSRRDRLPDLIRQYQAIFKSVTPNLWGQF